MGGWVCGGAGGGFCASTPTDSANTVEAMHPTRFRFIYDLLLKIRRVFLLQWAASRVPPASVIAMH
jgi:hypothetical protein